MNLRDNIATTIASRALAQGLITLVQYGKLSKIVREELEPKSIPFGSYSTADEALIKQFVEKYPLVATVRAHAHEVFAGCTITEYLTNDPEGCHTCYEGQQLVIYVDTDEERLDLFGVWMQTTGFVSQPVLIMRLLG